MADTRYEITLRRWQTFYDCTCPDRPASLRDADVIHWYMQHYNNCPPRRVEDYFLPAYPIEELA